MLQFPQLHCHDGIVLTIIYSCITTDKSIIYLFPIFTFLQIYQLTAGKTHDEIKLTQTHFQPLRYFLLSAIRSCRRWGRRLSRPEGCCNILLQRSRKVGCLGKDRRQKRSRDIRPCNITIKRHITPKKLAYHWVPRPQISGEVQKMVLSAIPQEWNPWL